MKPPIARGQSLPITRQATLLEAQKHCLSRGIHLQANGFDGCTRYKRTMADGSLPSGSPLYGPPLRAFKVRADRGVFLLNGQDVRDAFPETQRPEFDYAS